MKTKTFIKLCIFVAIVLGVHACSYNADQAREAAEAKQKAAEQARWNSLTPKQQKTELAKKKARQEKARQQRIVNDAVDFCERAYRVIDPNGLNAASYDNGQVWTEEGGMYSVIVNKIVARAYAGNYTVPEGCLLSYKNGHFDLVTMQN